MRERIRLGALAVLSVALQSHAQPTSPSESLVATTPTFAFHSDFLTNLHDALITAARASTRAEQALFHSAAEEACFSQLPPEEKSSWDNAVEYYADNIAVRGWEQREQLLLRTDLAGLREGWSTSAEDQAFIDSAREVRASAARVYEACRWTAQHAMNRLWIDDVTGLLAKHERTLVERLEKVYQKSFDGLPVRIDVVETANGNANSIGISPAGGHILISSSNEGIQDLHSLEMVFHEASHLVSAPWRGDPLPKALQETAALLNVTAPSDLWHVVLFYLTGETVRKTLAAGGEPDYTPYVYAQGLFERGGGGRWSRYRSPIEDAWSVYLEGEQTLSDAAAATLEALRD